MVRQSVRAVIGRSPLICCPVIMIGRVYLLLARLQAGLCFFPRHVAKAPDLGRSRARCSLSETPVWEACDVGRE
jgi:hypothetical protein